MSIDSDFMFLPIVQNLIWKCSHSTGDVCVDLKLPRNDDYVLCGTCVAFLYRQIYVRAIANHHIVPERGKHLYVKKKRRRQP